MVAGDKGFYYPKLTLSVFDFAMCKIRNTPLQSKALICSTRELNFAILIRQCSSSAIGPVSSASFLICSLSANTCQTKIDVDNHSYGTAMSMNDVVSTNIKQLLDEVEHDIKNYQSRGLCYLLKPKARGFDNS